MKTMLAILALCALCCSLSVAAEKKPLKVFVLAGQSNMQAHAKASVSYWLRCASSVSTITSGRSQSTGITLLSLSPREA